MDFKEIIVKANRHRFWVLKVCEFFAILQIFDGMKGFLALIQLSKKDLK